MMRNRFDEPNLIERLEDVENEMRMFRPAKYNALSAAVTAASLLGAAYMANVVLPEEKAEYSIEAQSFPEEPALPEEFVLINYEAPQNRSQPAYSAAPDDE